MNKPIVDGHMHISQWIMGDGRDVFEALREYQNKSGVAYVDNMSCSNNGNLWGGFEMDQSILGAIAKLENPTVFSHSCLYIPENPELRSKFDFVSQLDELMELGLDGVKICDFKPDAYKLLDVKNHLEDYDAYIGHCEKYGVHMCWHVADPDYCWDTNKAPDNFKKLGWFYGNGEYPSYEELIGLAYKMIENHPKLNLLLAHAFFKSDAPDEIEAILKKYPSICIDLAPGWEMFDGFRAHYEKWCNIFRKYSDRFIYGTDATICSSIDAMVSSAKCTQRFLETDGEFEIPTSRIAHGIKLEGEQLENVLFKTHQRTVGEKPREINKTALKKYIERYLPYMPDSKNRQLTEEYYRKNLL